jgi:hypothetical protein
LVHAHSFMCIASQLPGLQSSSSYSSPLHPPSNQGRLIPYHHFYEKIEIYLSQGYAVIYIVENDITTAVINLSKACSLEIEEYIEKGALTIVDANSFYSPSETKFDWELLLAQWQKVISSVSKKGRFKRVMVMGMPPAAVFDSKENQLKLIEYEEQVAKHYDGSLQVFCCYKKEMIDKLSLGYLLRLLAAHQDTAIGGNNNQVSFGPDIQRTIDIIEEGLTEALGKETCEIVLRTLKLIYKIDRDKILRNPENFEEKTRRILGKEAADSVLGIIAERIKREIVIQQQ